MGKAKKLTTPGSTRTVDKAYLTKPRGFCASWPTIDKPVERRIIEELKREIENHVCQRKVARGENKGTEAKKISLSPKKHPINTLLLVGINAVTKALEKGPLLLTMACRSANPLCMTQHLIPLCALRETPACCINGLSNTLVPILGIKSVLAIGFKAVEPNPLNDLIEFICDKSPPLNVPWVNIWKKKERHIKDKSLKGDGFKKETELNHDKEVSIEDRGKCVKVVEVRSEDDATSNKKNEEAKGMVKGGFACVKQDLTSPFKAESKCDWSEQQISKPNTSINKRKLLHEQEGSDIDATQKAEEKKLKVDDVAYDLRETQFNLRKSVLRLKK